MVDVWQELGRAVARALKPLADMADAVWSGLGTSTTNLVQRLMGGAKPLSDTVEPAVTQLMPDIFYNAAKALEAGSPPEEIKKAVDEFIKQLMLMIEVEAKTEGKSLPSDEELLKTEGKIVAGIIGMYAATHAISIALDATHPLKDWGFKTAIMDMLFQFKMSDVIGPMIQAPIWAAVVTPLRMKARAASPYDVPGTGVLPYLAAKNLITMGQYELSMRYHALDASWSSVMLANTARYPSFSELRTMIHRGVLTVDAAKAALRKSLVHTQYVDNYEALVPSIPGFGDLRRYAIREAFPDADTFQEHFERMKFWMRKQGYSEYFATADWNAHWIIISPGQADELLHRGDINEAQHTALYILNDIKPEHIPSIRKLTWKLPGRIESRWMFRWGEVNVTDLRNALVKDGLDPAYADQVARSVAKNQFLSDINRQIANSKASYVKGYSVEATLRADLTVLGLRSEMVTYHIMDSKADRDRALHDEALRTIRALYARGAINLAQVITAVTPIIVDKVVRDAWLAALPTAKQIIIIEETFGTEINRLVANAKYDYVRGYIEKAAMVSRFRLLELPVEVIQFHVIDADEDRNRRHLDKKLAIIEEGYVDDLINYENVEAMAKEILVDTAAYNLFLDEAWLNKHKAARVKAGE